MQHSTATGLTWRSATACNGGNCVQVAATDDGVAVRDSKNPDGGVQLYTASEWRSFLAGAKNGEFDDLI
ncbi:DUF397 domain-containing protein [Amorphoplanes digitatis]|uniref:DUF397 domain-containing protein n=1 Tax=Actinoplanes digitatis TaxID=1868 RepID=A0A7W7MTR7_9ACTN|nr:DUF397 domain-containing protein [Actinoplanes digitatis]MBB4766701.1 hypothetical protein [Actinoplanes digitatis]GID96205.1 DUF397 domain-containing protein [Actinoplanes digitatis]